MIIKGLGPLYAPQLCKTLSGGFGPAEMAESESVRALGDLCGHVPLGPYHTSFQGSQLHGCRNLIPKQATPKQGYGMNVA